MPAIAGRRIAGGDLPAQAGRLRPPGRLHRPPPGHPGGEERAPSRLHRRRTRVPHGRERPHAGRLRGGDPRAARPARRPHAHQHPRVPASRRGARRGDRHHRRHGGRPPPQHAGHQPPQPAPAGLRRGLRRNRGTARQGPRRPRASRERSHLHRYRLARVGGLRAHRQDRRAGAHHRRRQHRDGLLPLVAAPGRQGHQGHGAATPQLLQGLRVGAGGRRGGGGRDPRQPCADAFRHRGRTPHRHGVPAPRVG